MRLPRQPCLVLTTRQCVAGQCVAHTVPHGMCGQAAGVENIRWPRIKPLYYHCTAGSRARPCGLWPSLPCSWPPLPCLWPSLSRCEQDNIKVFLAAVCCLCLYFISSEGALYVILPYDYQAAARPLFEHTPVLNNNFEY